MLAVCDVHYPPDGGAFAACVTALGWEASTASSTHRVFVEHVAPYQPGRFFERELPPLLAVLALVTPAPEVVVLDGYVWLGEGRPGLGAHLHHALQGRAAVVGVAKTHFPGAPAQEVLRGTSQRPLWVTAAGMEMDVAVAAVHRMAGAHRLPALINQVDGLARRGV